MLRLSRSRGFTLVEVLVALAIVSIALMAALRAAGQATSASGELRLRLFAGWVAENMASDLDLKEARIGEIIFSTSLGVSTKAGAAV